MKTGKPQTTIDETITDDPIKCVRDLREVPPRTYRMAKDGRKAYWMSVRRAELVLRLATYANPDGSSIRVGVEEIMSQMGLSRSSANRLLTDLIALRFLENGDLDPFYKTRIRKLNVAAILRAAAMPPRVPDSRDKAGTCVPDSTPDVPDSRVRVPNSETHVPSSRPDVPNSFGTQPTSSPTSLPATPPPSIPPGQKSGVVGLAGDGTEDLWQQMIEHEDFPDEMLTAVPRKAQNEKLRVVEQLKACGVEAVVQAIATWADERDMGLRTLGTRWRAWLDEGDTLLRKYVEEEKASRAYAAKRAAEQIIIEENVQRQKDEHNRRFTAAAPENGASVEEYLVDA